VFVGLDTVPLRQVYKECKKKEKYWIRLKVATLNCIFEH
jgi:hypothetical protein